MRPGLPPGFPFSHGFLPRAREIPLLQRLRSRLRPVSFLSCGKCRRKGMPGRKYAWLTYAGVRNAHAPERGKRKSFPARQCASPERCPKADSSHSPASLRTFSFRAAPFPAQVLFRPCGAPIRASFRAPFPSFHKKTTRNGHPPLSFRPPSVFSPFAPLSKISPFAPFLIPDDAFSPSFFFFPAFPHSGCFVSM